MLTGILGGGLGRAVPNPPTPAPPTVPEPLPEPVALTVRVDIDGTRPPVWRRLVLHSDLMLDEVHANLQAAFGWQDYHLHRFWLGPTKQIWRGPHFVTEVDMQEGEEGVLESEVRLDQVLRSPGDRLFYTYDFGDGWTHTLRLESTARLDPDSAPAVCVGGRMAGPLEDCGGPDGHNELVEAYLSDPRLTGLDEDQRAWLPPDWDPKDLDLDGVAARLSWVGLSGDELLSMLPAADPSGAGLPGALESLLDLATPAVVSELAELSTQARTDITAQLTSEDLAAIARPYRYLVDLAGDEGIPLTAAGWMKPAYVEGTFRDLGMDDGWIGKGNREELTAPVAQLRATCQQLGLLRKHKGHLVRTRLARGLSSDEEYVGVITARLLHHRDTFVEASMVLFALFTAATGRPDWEHVERIAGIMTACGLRTGPHGVDSRHCQEWVRPVRFALRLAAGERSLGRTAGRHDYRAVALARAALWPAV